MINRFKHIISIVLLLSCYQQVSALDPAILNTDAINESKQIIDGSSYSIIVMRHGEQQSSEAIQSLAPSDKKIAMMRLPDNETDGLTQKSIEEALAVTQILQPIYRNKKPMIFTSKNKRAFNVAMIMKSELNTAIHIEKRLTCINYPSNDKVPFFKLKAMIPSGSLPWSINTVDQVLGKGSYRKITDSTIEFLNELMEEERHSIVITHTQQINAIQRHFQLDPDRLKNYGFIMITDKGIKPFNTGFLR